MRKITKRRKKVGISRLLFIFVLSLMCISIGYSLLSEEIQVNGKSTVVVSNDNNDKDNKLKMSYQKQTWGNNPYITQFDITVENISNESIDGWTFYIEIPENTKIVNAWSVKANIENNKLILKNEDYNSNISIDGKITFGIQIQSDTQNIELENPITDMGEEDNKNDEIIQNDELNILYSVDTKWQDANGYHTIYTVTIKNNGSPVNKWSIKLNLPSNTSYENSWNCNYIVQDNSILFSNVGYNGNLDTNASTTFGFVLISQSEELELVTEYISSN